MTPIAVSISSPARVPSWAAPSMKPWKSNEQCLLTVVGSGLWLQQGRAREEASEVARTLSFALQAPVAFNDQKGMDDALTLLRARPQVSGAWV